MADLAPTTLKNLWQSGQQGRLSPWQVARALALREASKECHGGQANLRWVASLYPSRLLTFKKIVHFTVATVILARRYLLDQHRYTA